MIDRDHELPIAKQAAELGISRGSVYSLPKPTSAADLKLMRRTVGPQVQVKAAGGVRTLDALLEVMSVGVTRVGATATETILEDFKARKAAVEPAAVATR